MKPSNQAPKIVGKGIFEKSANLTQEILPARKRMNRRKCV
jgi:hypothetical protein